MVVIVIVLVDNSDTEGVGVAKRAVIDTRNIEVTGETEITLRFQYRVNLHQAIADKIPFTFVVDCFLPKCIPSILILDGHGKSVIQQVPVGDGQFDFTPVVFEIIA